MANGDSFPPEVQEKLKTYVYRLIDPRNGETFYVGKGRGNRVFAHIREEQSFEGEENLKLETIRQIRVAGLEVGHVIHRHGMTDQEALHVEATLMDAYPGLTNIAGGSGSNEYGAMHAKEIIARYSAEPADFNQHKAILINVSRSAAERELLEATRYAWRMDRRKAEEAEVVLANQQGLIVEAFVPERWLEATAENFPGREDRPGRIGFEGRVAPQEIRQLYVGKRIPDEYRRPGAANPIRYTWSR